MILLITDLKPDDHESAVEGIFEHILIPDGKAIAVYFSPTIKTSYRTPMGIVIPHGCKHRGLIKTLNQTLTLAEKSSLRTIIVRNWFPVLRQTLRHPFGEPISLGFWETFPHAYRRVHEAEEEGRSVLRKRIEYAWTTWRENRLLSRCDFYLPISPSFVSEFRPALRIPTHPVPMGVDPNLAPDSRQHMTRTTAEKLSLVYIGAVDPLRKIDILIEAVSRIPEHVTLDIYTQNTDYARKLVASKHNVLLLPPLPRKELMHQLAAYDIGISLIPDNRLYRVASPTKTMEYSLCGLPSLMTRLPEHTLLLNSNEGLYCDMTTEAIESALRLIMTLPLEKRKDIGNAAKAAVLKYRNYSLLSAKLLKFLQPSTQ